MQILPQSWCVHREKKTRTLQQQNGVPEYSDNPPGSTAWKTRESYFSYNKVGCCDPGLRGLCGENPKSICWAGPGGIQEVLGQPTESGGQFPGNATPHQLIPRNRDPHRLCSGWLRWEILALFPLSAVSNCKKLYQRKLARAGKRTEEIGGKPRYFSFSVSIK